LVVFLATESISSSKRDGDKAVSSKDVSSVGETEGVRGVAVSPDLISTQQTDSGSDIKNSNGMSLQ